MNEPSRLTQPTGYSELLMDLKGQVRSPRAKAVRTVNTLLIELHWSISHGILVQQVQPGYGSCVIRRLAEDLPSEFTDMKGFSA